MSNDHEKDGHHSPHHILPLDVYWKVWGALVVLTILTVATSYIDLGGHKNILLAMAIAVTKALLVTNFFMGLKYDSAENNGTFYSSFIFLSIFVALVGSDWWFRKDNMPARVEASEQMGSGEPVDMKALMKPTPDLVAKGKALFNQQCVTCHGASGHGDGPAAAALNPKPRNFTATEGWKNGRTLSAMFKTLSNGLPGTPMPSFSSMGAGDRMALIQYVREEFMPDHGAKDSAAEVAALEAAGSGPAKKKLPIDFMLDRMSDK